MSRAHDAPSALRWAVALSFIAACALGCGKHATEEEEDEKAGATGRVAAPPTSPSQDVVGALDARAKAQTKATTEASASGTPAPRVSGPQLGCCDSLRQSSSGVSPQEQGAFLMAAQSCDAMIKTGRLDVGRLRSMTLGAPLPASCR